MKQERVVILGASDKPTRYSYRAFQMLKERHHTVFLVSPNYSEIEGHACVSRLQELMGHAIPVDTITVYVRLQVSSQMLDGFIALSPKRVIFNPGSENPDLEEALEKQGIIIEQACTLVLLSTGQF